MKKGFILVVFCSAAMLVKGQKVGIGTNTPAMALEIKSADTALLQLSNSNPLDANTNLGLYFKNGNWYTGALRSIGTTDNSARLGIFTFAGTSASDLKERISITDHGYIGINTTEPESHLHVVGTQIIRNPGYGGAALEVVSTNPTPGLPAASIEGAGGGIIAGTTSPAGTGIVAWNAPNWVSGQPGTALTAMSSEGHGIYAQTSKPSSYSILGHSGAANITAGRFQNAAGGKALVTSGAVQIEGQGAGAGKVLTSDALGNATWQTPAVIAFRGHLSYNIPLSPTSTYPITGITALANDGNALNSAAGEFTAPSDGWYEFTVNVQYTLPASEMRLAIDFLRNGVSNIGTVYQFQVTPSASGQLDTRSITQKFKLIANDKISFQFRHTGGTGTINIFGQAATTTTMFYGMKL